MAKRSRKDVHFWINYVVVESLDGAIERAQKLGAKLDAPRTPVPGMGYFAMLLDPEGNTLALWESDPKAK